jgi:hypothetical protein
MASPKKKKMNKGKGNKPIVFRVWEKECQVSTANVSSQKEKFPTAFVTNGRPWVTAERRGTSFNFVQRAFLV